eukprot:842701-Prorocentrum_minimum.AAC.1
MSSTDTSLPPAGTSLFLYARMDSHASTAQMPSCKGTKECEKTARVVSQGQPSEAPPGWEKLQRLEKVWSLEGSAGGSAFLGGRVRRGVGKGDRKQKRELLTFSRTWSAPVPKDSSPQTESLPASMRLPKNFHPVGVSKKGTFIFSATRSRAAEVGMERARPCVVNIGGGFIGQV